MVSRLAFLSLGLLLATMPAAHAQGGEPSRYGPWDRNLEAWVTRDGRVEDGPACFVERAGVPTLARDRAGRLVAVFQWFPTDRPDSFDRVAVAFSADEGKSWSGPATLAFAGLPEGYERPYDPTLVLLADGRLRLYFTSRDLRGEKKAIYSSAAAGRASGAPRPGTARRGRCGRDRGSGGPILGWRFSTTGDCSGW